MKSREIMSSALYCCTPDETAERAAQLMRDHDIGSIPIVNDCRECKLLGIVTDRDLCLAVVAAGQSPREARVSEIMSKWPATCSPEDPVEVCEEIMRRRQVRRIPVVDARGVCLGVVSQADIALRDTEDHVWRTLAAISRHAHGATAGNGPAIH